MMQVGFFEFGMSTGMLAGLIAKPSLAIPFALFFLGV